MWQSGQPRSGATSVHRHDTSGATSMHRHDTPAVTVVHALLRCRCSVTPSMSEFGRCRAGRNPDDAAVTGLPVVRRLHILALRTTTVSLMPINRRRECPLHRNSASVMRLWAVVPWVLARAALAQGRHLLSDQYAEESQGIELLRGPRWRRDDTCYPISKPRNRGALNYCESRLGARTPPAIGAVCRGIARH